MARSDLDVVIQGQDNLTPEIRKIESNIIRFVGFVSATLAAIRIGAAPILAAAAFEREMANVAKTTDFAKGSVGGMTGQLDLLGSKLLEMSTTVDVSAVDLAKIAAAAGQQGLGRFGVEGVVQFTDSVARMASVLDITAEEAGTNIGKIINIFKTPLNEIERAISTINEVANNSTAEGKELLDVVKRIGDAAGSLDLKSATALAATGLDFGQSPEVVGTAFARVFSAMFEKADQFARLMKVPVNEFIRSLKTDGLKAYLDFLGAVRQLNEQKQQEVITKLIGGGRIGALINKQVQDTGDTVIQRNLASAERGGDATSALKEQARVLDNLSSQSKILLNSLIKLGNDASAQLLGPLTQYVRQLQEVLANEKVRSFVSAAMAAVGELLNRIVTLVSFVGSLNVNWENFFKVVQLFSTIKLGEAILGLISRMTGFNLVLKSSAKSADDAAKSSKKVADAATEAALAEEAAATKSKASWLARKLGLDEVTKAWADYKRGVEEAQRAEQALASSPTPAARPAAAVNPVNEGVQRTVQAQANVASATSAVAAARATQIATQAKLEAQAKAESDKLVAERAARIAALEKVSNERIFDINQDFRARRKILAQQGAVEQIDIALREKTALIASEREALSAQIAGLDRHYTERAAKLTQALSAENAIARKALADRLRDLRAAQREVAALAPITVNKPATAPVVDVASPTAKADAAAAVQQQAARVASVQQQASAIDAGIQKARNAAIQQAEKLNAQARLAINQEYVTRRRAIEESGTEAGLLANKAAQAKAVSLLAQSHADQLAAINASYDKRAAVQAERLAQELAREKAALAERTALLRSIVATPAAPTSKPSAPTATNAAGTVAAAGASVATAGINAITGAASLATRAVQLLGVALRTIATVAVAAGRLIASGFFWVTLIYSALDAIGLLDNVLPVIQRVTDALGLTSEARRKDAQARKDEIEQSNKLRAALEQETKAFRENIDARTGRLGDKSVAGLVTQASKGGTEEVKNTAVEKLSDIAGGIAATARSGQSVSLDNDLKAAEAKVQEFADKIKRIKDRLATEGDLPSALVKGSTERLKTLGDALSKAEADVKRYQQAQAQGTGEVDTAAQAYKDLGDKIAGLFTPQSVQALQDYILPIAQGSKDVDTFKTKLQEALNASNKDTAAGQKLIKERETDLRAATQRADEARKKWREFIVAMEAKGATSPIMLLALQFLDRLDGASVEKVQGLVNALATQPASALTGKDAPAPTPKAAGDADFDIKERQAAIRRRADAELALKREINKQEDALADERSKQQLAADQRLYDQGLKGLEEFYAARRKIQLDDIARDIAGKERDVGDTKAARARVTGKDPAAQTERLTLDRQIVALEGQIKVLEQRKVEVSAENAEALRKALQDFNDRVLSETNKLVDADIIPGTVQDRFNANLEEMLARYREFINQLKSNAKTLKLGEDFEKALTDSFKGDSLKKALQPVFADIDRVFTQLQQTQAKIAIAKDAGAVTSVEAERQYEDAIRKQVVLLQEKEAMLTSSLSLAREGTKDYRELSDSVEATRLRVAQLSLELDKTAKSINQGLTDSLADSLDKLTSYGSSLKEVTRGFLFDLAGQIKRIFLKDIAESITGGAGSGGLGGLIQKALRSGPSGSRDAGSPGSKESVSLGPDGSAAKPFTVIVQGGIPVPGVTPAAPGTVPVITPTGGPAQTFPVGNTAPVDSPLNGDIQEELLTSQQQGVQATTETTGALTQLAEQAKNTGIAMDLAAAATGNFAPLINRITNSLLNTAVEKGVGAVTGKAVEGAAGAAAGGTAAAAVSTAGAAVATAIGGAGTSLSTALAIAGTAVSGGAAAVVNALLLAGSAIAAAAAQIAVKAAVATVAHTGGIIGSGQLVSRSISPLMFAAAPRYHVGGVAGLRPGEVPAILQKGEAVLTENQQSLVAAAMSTGKGGGEMSIRNVLVTDPNFVTDAMASSEGERTVMTVLSKNRAALKQIIS